MTLARLTIKTSKNIDLMSKHNPTRIALGRLPTPVERLEGSKKYKKHLDKRDDLSEASLSGNKVRKLEYIAAEALEEKAIY